LEVSKLEFRETTLPELVEKVGRRHTDEQDAQHLSTRTEDAEQIGGFDVHALTVASVQVKQHGQHLNTTRE
jgi:hypothetical protein